MALWMRSVARALWTCCALCAGQAKCCCTVRKSQKLSRFCCTQGLAQLMFVAVLKLTPVLAFSVDQTILIGLFCQAVWASVR